MIKYLYGASVQGIQEFIFQTNKLREIAGASELVEQICTTEFARTLGYDPNFFDEDPNAIITAAGNIRYVFEKKADCERVVRTFPKLVAEFAPGISLSQAVVKIDEEQAGKKHFDWLEKKMRAQRNRKIRPIDLGLLAVNRSRRTGIPASTIKTVKHEATIVDNGTAKKLEVESNRILSAFFSDYSDKQIPWDMKDMTKSKNQNYSWLAVVHADGNNMGIILQNLSRIIEDNDSINYLEKLRDFSKMIDKSTKDAARQAYQEVIQKMKDKEKKILPFRPIVIGGDDLTLICRADIALDFTEKFLKYFEQITRTNIKGLNVKAIQDGITACAGIAFIKESYPFHYGYSLSEELCSFAKKAAKELSGSENRTPSCLMFHKVQDSFVEDFSEIQKRELYMDLSKTRLDYGPYFLDKQTEYDTIEGLINKVNQFKSDEGNAVKSNLRQWLTDLHNNPELAEQKLDRTISVAGPRTRGILKELKLPGSAIKNDKSPVHDWLTINSLL